jgi:hypothetical protein
MFDVDSKSYSLLFDFHDTNLILLFVIFVALVKGTPEQTIDDVDTIILRTAENSDVADITAKDSVWVFRSKVYIIQLKLRAIILIYVSVGLYSRGNI